MTSDDGPEIAKPIGVLGLWGIAILIVEIRWGPGLHGGFAWGELVPICMFIAASVHASRYTTLYVCHGLFGCAVGLLFVTAHEGLLVRCSPWSAAGILAVTLSGMAGLACFVAYVSRRYARRARRGYPHCEKCGYLLIGLTEMRCPECGTPFEVPAAPRDPEAGQR